VLTATGLVNVKEQSLTPYRINTPKQISKNSVLNVVQIRPWGGLCANG